MKSSSEIGKIRNKFQSLLVEDSEDEGIDHDAFILMANYLSEIERLKIELNFTQQTLAKKINNSSSYLTQVFRGNKPLNFRTLAKIQKALKITFQVKAVSIF